MMQDVSLHGSKTVSVDPVHLFAHIGCMNSEPRTVHKIVSFSSSEGKDVGGWMHENSIHIEADAVRRLIELGLEAARQQPEKAL